MGRTRAYMRFSVSCGGSLYGQNDNNSLFFRRNTRQLDGTILLNELNRIRFCLLRNPKRRFSESDVRLTTERSALRTTDVVTRRVA